MMGKWMPKHVEKRNKQIYVKQNCAPSWIYLRDYTGMQSQQNRKFFTCRCEKTSMKKLILHCMRIWIIPTKSTHKVLLFNHLDHTTTQRTHAPFKAMVLYTYCICN